MTIAIILSTHGSASKEILRTSEMITGPQKNVAWIELLPEENMDILLHKYNVALSKLSINSGILFLVDIWGGTPFNAAQRIMIHQKNCDIITGISIPMLIEIFITRDRIKSVQELVQAAVQSGIESIKSVKHSFIQNKSFDKTKDISTTPQNITYSNTTLNQDDSNHLTICVARIDDRLIHGQVVTRWAKEYDINRIIVINNEISKDVIRKNLLTQVTPPGITAHVIDVPKAIRVYNNPKYSKDKVIMLFTNPNDVLSLIEGGVKIKSINIGGMAFCQGKKQINNAISVNSADIQAFKKLNKLGIELEIRKVPSDSSLKLMKLIENIQDM